MGKASDLIMLCAITAMSASLHSASNISDVKIVSGAFMREIDGVMLFEKFIPVTFYSTLPKMISHFGSVETCKAKPFICRLYKEMTVLMTQGQISLLDLSPYIWKSTNEHLRKQRRFLGIATQSQISELHADQLSLEKYMDKIVATTIGDHEALTKVVKDIHSYSVELRAQLFHSTRNLSQILSSMQAAELDDEIIIAALLQNVAIMSFQMDMVQTMHTAAAECRNGFFSRSLVPQEKFMKQLSALRSELNTNGWEIVGTASELLKQQFGDCIFGTSTVIHSFKLPIKRRFSEFKIREVIKLPFQFQQSTCTINEDTKFVITDKEKIVSLVDGYGDDCNVSKGFCRVRLNTFDENHFSECAQSILDKVDLEENAKKCIFRCKSNDNQLIVTEIGNGQTALANAKQVVSTCNGTSAVTEFPQQVGAVIIRIPCVCKLLVNKEHTVRPEFPCIKENAISNISFVVHVPSQWLHPNMTNISDADLNMTSLIPAIDTEWAFRVPIVNVTPPVLAHIERVRLSQRMATYEDTGFLVYVWLTILSLVVTVLALKFGAEMGMNYLNARTGGGMGMMGMLPSARAVSPGDVGDFFVDKVKEIEIGAGVIVIMWIIVGIVAFCIGLKILRGVNRISSTIDYFAKDDEEMVGGRFRRSNSHRR